jgi:DNA-binding LacI/PurR family transcriptional regulator
MTETKFPDKAARLTAYIEEKISSGEYGGGSQTPTVRELAERFGLTYSTAKRGVDYLSSKGLLEKVQGKGIFVSRKRAPAKTGGAAVSVIYPRGTPGGPPRGVYSTVFTGIQEAAAAGNIPLSINYMPEKEFSAEKALAISGGSRALILLGEYDALSENLSFTKSAVGVCMSGAGEGNISIVDIDPFAAAASSVRYFKERGARKVSVISDPRPAYLLRAKIFASSWTAAGGVTKEFLTGADDYTPAKGSAAFFSTCSLLQRHSVEYKRESGRELSEDLTVIGVDGKNLIDPDFHRMTSVALDWRAAGAAAVTECVRRAENPGSPPQRIYLRGYLKIK